MICKIRCEYVRGDVHDVYTDFAPTEEMANILIAIHRSALLAFLGIEIPLSSYKIIPFCGGDDYEECNG